MTALVCRFVRTRAGLVPVAVVWSPAETAVLARDLATATGHPAQPLPNRFQENR